MNSKLQEEYNYIFQTSIYRLIDEKGNSLDFCVLDSRLPDMWRVTLMPHWPEVRFGSLIRLYISVYINSSIY